ncbi:MAG: zinc ribbon domain-containing protein [Proteobacteria bacterium]|nr:zinc ribbon domain-containing protein [Pseudomonadota bacterium]NBP13661.1 zinc ribbon domain-containing protein [bacterium]
MLYDYKCENCDHEMIDVYQSIKDDALVVCPSCGQSSLARVIYGGLGSFMKDVKTIGQLADKNWKELGHYQRSEKEQKAKEERQKQEVSAFSSAGSATKKEINKMTPAQKTKYIMTGDK